MKLVVNLLKIDNEKKGKTSPREKRAIHIKKYSLYEANLNAEAIV